MIIVRYADDIVVGFEYEADARRFWDAMQKRFEEFALSLNPDKTRLIEFGRHAAVRRTRRRLGKPETFNFLGFTFICGRSRAGKFLIKRKSRRDRMRTKLQENQGGDAAAQASADPRAREVAGAGRQGLLCLPRRADQLGVDPGFPSLCGRPLAPLALATEPTRQGHMATDQADRR